MLATRVRRKPIVLRMILLDGHRARRSALSLRRHGRTWPGQGTKIAGQAECQLLGRNGLASSTKGTYGRSLPLRSANFASCRVAEVYAGFGRSARAEPS